MKYAFPILTSDGKEFTDVKALNGLLQGASGGHYLLGGHDKWHGGIHISEQTAPWCRDKHPVRCIADGKVVAFRMLPDYLDSTFLGQTLKYSNCFCLVEHTYCETNPDTKTSNEFTFYSLYMHLLPWDHYQQGERLVLKANRNVRNSVPHLHPDPAQALSDKQLPTLTLPAGTEFLRVAGVPLKRGTLGKTDYDFARVKVLSAGKQSDKVLATQGCEVWLAMDEEAVTTIVPKLPNWLDDQIEAELTQAMTGRADPVSGETGQLPGAGKHHVSLPAGTWIRFDAHRLEFQLIDGQPRKMARCDFETSAQGGLCGQAWVCVEDKFIKVLNQSASHLGTLYPLPNPVPIAAGDTIGYLGLVETPASLVETDAKRSIHQVHIEVFSQDPRLAEVLANKANTKGSASYAKVPGGLPLAKQTKLDGKISFTPTETLSAEVLLDSPKQAKDNANIDWIEVQAGLFVQQSKVEMLSQHDWLKIGFQQIDGSGSDGHLAAGGPSPFFLELAKAIDPKREGELTSTDVRKILQDKSKATKIQKLIVKHPSEWYEKSAAPSYQWLENLMAEVGLPEFDKLVDHEKQRIDSLEWMQSAKELKLGPEVWHIYPLVFHNKKRDRFIVNYTKYNYPLSRALDKQMSIPSKYAPKVGNFQLATREEVLKNLTPDGDLTKDSIYQFLDLSKYSEVPLDEINKFLSGQGVLEGKGHVFITAAQKYNVSEVYLVAHASLETGRGSSGFARGKEYNGTKVYNMYGINVRDDQPSLGTKYAYNRGWNSIDKAIDGGAKWISENFVNHPKYKQNTLYKMRWNPASPAEHQYASDVLWAKHQIPNIKKRFDIFPEAILYVDIPVYEEEQ